MKNTVVHLGAVSKRTLDFSGNNWWDSVLFLLRRVWVGW